MQHYVPMFRRQDQAPSLVGYLPALYPNKDEYMHILKACAQAGLRYLEIGIPVENPYLDGKAIQDALLRVQQQYPQVDQVIRMAIRAVRSAGLIGIVMLYYETVEQYGLKAFADLLIEEAAEGVLIPNIPFEQRQELARLLEGTSVATINFVRYETDETEMRNIIRDTTGFLYLQSMKGATGGTFKVDEQLGDKIKTLRTLAKDANLPVALGFGISTAANAKKAAETDAEAIIIGTGLVLSAKEGPQQVKKYLGQFSPYLNRETTLQYLLSVDAGTTALKSSIIASDGTLIDSAISEYPLIAEGNTVEQDPELWWSAFCTTARTLRSRNASIELAGVVLSGQMQDLILLDAKHQLIGNAILYSDTRAQKEFERYKEQFTLERAMQITRNSSDAASLPPKLMHILAKRGSLDDVHFLLGSHDYLCLKLTGKQVTDLTNAATTGLLSYETKTWSEEILQYVGISSDQLPHLETEISVTGTVTAQAAMATGLAQGLPVIHGSGDAASSTVGVGAADENVFSCYLGTSGWVAATLPTPIDPAKGVFNLCHPDGKQTITIGAMRTTGGNISWILEAFAITDDKYARMQEIAEKAPVGSGGVFFLPYLQGERMPFNDPYARGAFIGLNRDTAQAHMLRCVIEGIAYGLATIYEVLKESSAGQSIRVVASGGGAENRLLTQTLSDILGVPVLKIRDASNAGVRGNLVLAGKALGWFDSFSLQQVFMQTEQTFYPDQEAHAYHMKAFPLFKNLYLALKNEFCNMANIV